jgi:hypothetical protein
MFGDLLKGLLQKKFQSTIQEKLGGNASIIQNLFKFTGQGNPMSDIFGDKWQEGSPQQPQWMDMLHRPQSPTSNQEGFNFKDILKVLNR